MRPTNQPELQRLAGCILSFPIQVPDAADNFLSFSAVLEAPTAADGASRGAVTAHFGKPGAVAAGQLATRGACSGVPWPALQGVRFLGVHTQVTVYGIGA